LAVLFHSNEDDPFAWAKVLRQRLPDIDLRVWPEIGDPADIELALVWRPPPGLLAGLPNLRAIQSLGAGVDALLADPTLPDLPLCRMVEPSLARGMAELALTFVLAYHRRLEVFAAQQREAVWRFELPRLPAATRVGVMGLGAMGGAVARALADHGFAVRGWSRSPHDLAGVTSFAGKDGLAPFLGETDILVCLLPLTAETERILAAPLFAGLPPGARLINLARGRHLVEADLLRALDSGQLAHATLDVFREEPLPAGHPFWRHPSIRITPHVASYSDPAVAADLVVENLRRLRAGEPLLHVVDRKRGY
jgi:glyoxylate/hydroxypyruvate reductase A